MLNNLYTPVPSHWLWALPPLSHGAGGSPREFAVPAQMFESAQPGPLDCTPRETLNIVPQSPGGP